jgi:hypothetical protein
MSTDITQSFFEGTPSTLTAEIVDESCENLQLQVAPITNTTTPTTIAHQRRARELHAKAVAQTSDLFETLNAIREEKAYLSLGHSSFENYVKALKREAQYLSIDVSTFYRKLAHREVTQTLSEAGVNTRNLTHQQSAKLNQLPPALQAETYKLAQEKSAEEPPQGKAGEFHHHGKVYLEKLDEAIAETTGRVLDEVEGEEPDPFDPNEETTGRPDFFSPQNRQRVSEKPLPPPMPTEGAETQEEDEDGEMLALLKITPIEGEGGSFLFLTGTNGMNNYTIPVRVEQVREALRK